MSKEIDAMVAERVMGRTDVRVEDSIRGGKLFMLGPERMPMPNYSTDISAAWQVVEKMRERGLHVAINTAGRRWYASFARGSETDEGGALWGDWGDTAMDAICKAALAAVKAEVRP